jgi:predicted O-methyltransferase YrrM
MSLPQHIINQAPVNWNKLPAPVYMTKMEIEVLVTLLSTVAPRTIAEIGVQEGRTARALLAELQTIERYIGIDVPYDHTPTLAVQRPEIPTNAGWYVIEDSRFQLIVKENGSRDLIASDLPVLDAIFIDGDHSMVGVSLDSVLAHAVVRPGGIIIWHDYTSVYIRDVTDTLNDLARLGHDIKHAAGTWLAYEYQK